MMTSVVAISLVLSLPVSAVAMPPNGTLSVAYRQRAEGPSVANPKPVLTWVARLARLVAAVRSVATGAERPEGLSESVHHVTLMCWDGSCSLTTLTLNQCGPIISDRNVFYPKVERSSTDEGGLTVFEPQEGRLLVEQRVGLPTDLAVFKYQFAYSARRDSELGKTLRLKSDRFFGELRGFSGAVVKDSRLLNKVISWELVPLKGRNATIRAACDILLDGVPE